MWQRMNSVNQVFLAAQKNTLNNPSTHQCQRLDITPIFQHESAIV